MTQTLHFLILYDQEKIGSKNQCHYLFDALTQTFDAQGISISLNASCAIPKAWFLRVLLKWLWRFVDVTKIGLPASFDQVDYIISSGTRAAITARMLKHLAPQKPKLINILDPRSGRQEFDFIVTPQHDQLKATTLKGTLIAPLGPLTPAVNLNQNSRTNMLAVLLGGPSKHTHLCDTALLDFLMSLKQHLKTTQQKTWISFSRRTPDTWKQLVQETLGVMLNLEVYDPDHSTNDNPYTDYLQQASTFVVTPDSMSMIAECAATGQSTYVLRPKRVRAKSKRFLELLERENHIRFFTSSFKPYAQTPLRTTEFAAAEITAQHLQQASSKPHRK